MMVSIHINTIILVSILILIIFFIIFWMFNRRVDRYKTLAISDDLGVFNHRELNSKIKFLMRKPDVENFVFMLLDIDFFKNYNDQYGYSKADHILQDFVNLVKGYIRKTDLFFRYKNGDEFVLIFSNTGVEQAEEIGNRLRRVIAYHPFQLDDQQVHLTISMGITTSIKDDTPEQIKHRAEEALLEAKQSKNTVVLIEE
ncbi:MAG: GGDEF domain-containing protein [Bacteroidales bacterium]|jgi:diguanylate cyclase (GGDEF)-like protein|nr:GGDEF domain-containing protein [Bacteroidales bacterium]